MKMAWLLTIMGERSACFGVLRVGKMVDGRFVVGFGGGGGVGVNVSIGD